MISGSPNGMIGTEELSFQEWECFGMGRAERHLIRYGPAANRAGPGRPQATGSLPGPATVRVTVTVTSESESKAGPRAR